MLNLPLLQTATPKHPHPQLISQGSGRSPSAPLINEAEEPDLKEEPYGGIFLSVLLSRLAPKAPTADVADGSGATGRTEQDQLCPQLPQKGWRGTHYPPHSAPGANTALKGWSP